MKQKILTYGCLLLVTCSACGEQSALEPRILHDPFAKPTLRKLPQSSGNTIVPNAEAGPWAPKLTSTLRAGRNSMVIVGGRSIRLGEEIEGFKLIEVDERSAVFVKDLQRKRLTLDDNE